MPRDTDKGPLSPVDTLPDATELADPTVRTRLPEAPEPERGPDATSDLEDAAEHPDATVTDYRIDDDAGMEPESEQADLFDAGALLPQQTVSQELLPGAYADETDLDPSTDATEAVDPYADATAAADSCTDATDVVDPYADLTAAADRYADAGDLPDPAQGPLSPTGTLSIDEDEILEIVSSSEVLVVGEPRDEGEVLRGRGRDQDVTMADARPASEPDAERAPPQGISWEGRFVRLEQELAECDLSGRRVELLIEMGAIADDRLDDRGQARECFGRALKLDPGNARAFEQLERIYEQEWEPELQIELLVNRTEHVSAPAEQARLLHRVARLYEQQEEPDKAIIALEAAAAAAPGDDAIARELERLTAPPAPPEPVDPLERLEAQLGEASSDGRRVELLESMAAIWLQRVLPERAVECLDQILALDPRREACYRKLEQIHQQASRTDLLAATLRRHIPVAAPQERLELGLRLAKLYEGPLSDLRRAAETYQGMLGLDPAHAQTLSALARLTEELGDWAEAARVTRELIKVTRNTAAGVDLLYRLAWIHGEQLRDPGAAEGCLLEAVGLAPASAKAVGRLAEIYKSRGDWGKVAKLMLAAAAESPSPLEQARWLYEAGVATLEGLDDEDEAVRLFERTLAVDPDHAGAAGPLSEVYFRRGRHADLAPVLDLLLRKADPSDPRRLLELSYMAAATAEAQDSPDRAMKYYRRAHELDPEHLPTLQGLARLSVAAQDWRAGRRWCERLLAFKQQLDPDDQVEAVHQLACCVERGGDRRQAIQAYQQVLELEPGHRPSLEALAGLLTQASDWQGLLQAKHALLEAADDEQQVELQREIGEVLWRRLGRLDQAEQAYRAALQLQPDNHVVLHELIELYSAAQRWPEMIEICQLMAEIEAKAEHRAKYYFTAAVICRDKLQRLDQAIDFFNLVLDQDSGHLKAFEAIDAICTQQRNWKQLQKNYVRMIQRLPQDEGLNELKVMLWHNLGEVLRSRRRDFESAITAFEAAARLEPENVQRRKILAELYLSSGEKYLDQALAAHHELILQAPRQIELYHALQRAYMGAGRYDQAWCISAALALMQQADPEELSLFSRYRFTRVVQAGAPMTDEVWRKLIHHEDQSPYINTIFAVVAPVVASMTVRPISHYGLKERERVDPARETQFFVQLFYYATRALNVTPAALYLDPRRPGALLMAHTPDVPSFVAGVDLLQGRSEKEQAFVVGKQLTYLRPEHFLRNALPTRSQLQTVLLAALQLCSADPSLPADEAKAVKPVVERLNAHLGVAQKEQLAHLIQRLSPADTAGIERWWRCLDLVSDRVGLIICNDLEIAAGMINADPAASEIPAGERINQLLRYATSEAYFAARSRLRLTIDQGA